MGILEIMIAIKELISMAMENTLPAFLWLILPFFAILMHYKNFYAQIFAHASFLYLILLIREIVKDLENIQGDIANNYQTIPVRFGENFAKNVILVLTLFTVIPVYFLVEIFEVGYMDIYFYGSILLLIMFLLALFQADKKEHFIKLHFLLKVIILLGVFSIILIDPEVLIHGRNYIVK